MSVTALIKFTQNAVVGTAGQAYEGTVANGVVTIQNNDNTNVTAWTITLLDVPPNSAIVPGVLGTASNNNPTATFTPDVPGSYRILLSVTDGVTPDKDIRNFGIRNARGIIIPSYQKLPDPLPLQGVGSKPDEQNYGGQLRGWTGNRTDGNLEQFFLTYDDQATLTVTSTPFTASNTNQGPFYFVNISGAAVFNLPSGCRAGQVFRVVASSTITTLTVNPPGGHTIDGLSSIQMFGYGSGTFVFQGGSSWTLLGAKKSNYERELVAGLQDTDQTGFVIVGAATINTGDYPNTLTTTWQALIETTNVADGAEIRLFNVTTFSVVAGSVLSTTNVTPTLVTASITLAAGSNIYEAQLRLQGVGSPDRATCRQAQILINWLQA